MAGSAVAWMGRDFSACMAEAAAVGFQVVVGVGLVGFLMVARGARLGP